MKPEVHQTLLTAKVLLNKAQDLCFVEDKNTASAGLIVLQDALELIFLSCLIERGVDETKHLENISFDNLIGELKKNGIKVVKSGTLKALNKQRVIVKHYGQVSDPPSVARYYTAAEQAINEVLKPVIGKTLQEVSLHELIKDSEAKGYFNEAVGAFDKKAFFQTLVGIRKAIFVEIMEEYCIYGYRDKDETDIFSFLVSGGHNAPFYTRNKKWISESVTDPFGFIQLDHDRLRTDLLEWGCSTQDFWNIWRLTPEVIRLEKGGKWLVKGILNYHQLTTSENARYCLDRGITIIYRKQAHEGLSRHISYPPELAMYAVTNKPVSVFRKASKNSEKVADLPENTTCTAHEIVPALDGNGRFVSIGLYSVQKPIAGYIDKAECEIVKGTEKQNTGR